MTRSEKDMREFLSLLMLVLLIVAGVALTMLGCGSADGYPSTPREASPEPQHESSVVACSAASDDFIAWQSDGLTHVSRRTGPRRSIVQHYDRETPFEADFQGMTVLVSNELEVCVIQ